MGRCIDGSLRCGRIAAKSHGFGIDGRECARENGLRYDSAYCDLGVRDSEITAHAAFRKSLYDHDVVPDAEALAATLAPCLRVCCRLRLTITLAVRLFARPQRPWRGRQLRDRMEAARCMSPLGPVRLCRPRPPTVRFTLH